MDGTLGLAVQGLQLTGKQWREVERQLELCLKEHRISTAEYLAAMSEVRVHVKRPSPRPRVARAAMKAAAAV